MTSGLVDLTLKLLIVRINITRHAAPNLHLLLFITSA